MKYFIVIILLSVNFAQAQAATNSLEICKTLNSIDVYTNSNLTNLQKYLQNFFPKLKTSGENDSQNKYYISKYQYAFGLKTTGTFNPETLQFLRRENNCFDLGKTVVRKENSIQIILMSQEELIQKLISNFVNTQ